MGLRPQPSDAITEQQANRSSDGTSCQLHPLRGAKPACEHQCCGNNEKHQRCGQHGIEGSVA